MTIRRESKREKQKTERVLAPVATELAPEPLVYDETKTMTTVSMKKPKKVVKKKTKKK